MGSVTAGTLRKAARDVAGSSTPRSTRRDARQPALGTHDGISFTFPAERTSREIAEALDWDTGELVYNDEKRRLQRWEMQASARHLLEHDRLSQCYRVVLNSDKGVRVWRKASSSTYYKGLRVCGLVWACPVCAAKIAERRRAELIEAMDKHKAAGGTTWLMTLTVPHSREQKAFGLTEQLLKAYTAFGGGKKAWKSILPGVVGSVRALEVTHGEANGWHPHLHVLVFLDGEADPKQYEERMLSQWAKVVKRHKLGDVNEHGLRLEDGSKAAKYASKWGLEDEMTKAHIKQGRKGGNRTPWALLADYNQGDKRAGRLFIEFFEAFQGKSQLHWARGLKDRFGLKEKTDEDLADERVNPDDLLVAQLNIEDWKLIRKHNLRGLVLELLRTADRSAVDLLLAQYRDATHAPEAGDAPPQTTEAGSPDSATCDATRPPTQEKTTHETQKAPRKSRQAEEKRWRKINARVRRCREFFEPDPATAPPARTDETEFRHVRE